LTLPTAGSHDLARMHISHTQDKRNAKTDEEAQTELKKFPQIIAGIKRDWPGKGPIRIMFQDKARFGRMERIHRRLVITRLCHGSEVN
jgi:hypothetical protein